MRGRTTVVLRVAGVGLLTAAAVLSGVSSDAARAVDSGSARTVSGTGGFASLKVTVAKTEALGNEVVRVSWSGGTPTQGNFATDYLQVFQCWGTGAGPTREQCQFGGLTGDPRGGAQVASRQLTYDIKDPLETLVPQSPGQLRFAPFTSATGKTREAGLSEFFDASTTNEVPFAQTRSDGGGEIAFEVQTATEAPGLGCGEPVTSVTGTTGRGCFLVVVPRGRTEVDGSVRSSDTTNQLLSSPLSESNWRNRLVVPLAFSPLGQPCPLGRSERPVVGQEAAVEAVASWQPALCADEAAPVYSFSQVPDTIARRQATSDAAQLSLTTRPLEGIAADSATGLPVYAPVALSGLAVAFNIESQSSSRAPESVKQRDGQRLAELNLTPRLVAKLLTQSYQLAAAPERPGLEKNPLDLTRDPEFLAANPAFAELRFPGIADITVPLVQSDAHGQLWRWILADAEAKAWVGGAPDPSGMVINPAYVGIDQQDGFPKSDTVCRTFVTDQPPLCVFDAHPYAADGHEAARGAARGDDLSRTTYDATALPPTYKRSAPQLTGSRALLVLTDTATAARFGLQTAALRTSTGAFVAPDTAGLAAGLAAMDEVPVTAAGSTSVLSLDPATKAAGAYPLTSLTYAVGVPGLLSAEAREDYGAFLRYAAGPGQVPGVTPGLLPPGYAPLPEELRTQTVAAAAVYEAKAVPAPTAVPTVAITAPTTPSTTDDGPGTGVPAGVSGPLPVGPVVPGSTTPPFTTPPAPVAATPQATVVLASRTPVEEVGGSRYGVVLALALGGFAALGVPGLQRLTRRPAVTAA